MISRCPEISNNSGRVKRVVIYRDDLTEIVDENKRNRESEARKADKLIDKGVENYLQQLRSLDVVSTLKAYHKKSELTRDIELEKALKQLAKGENAEQVLAQLARNLTSRFMHLPSIAMKQASADGHEDKVGWAHQLFELQIEKEPEDENNKEIP